MVLRPTRTNTTMPVLRHETHDHPSPASLSPKRRSHQSRRRSSTHQPKSTIYNPPVQHRQRHHPRFIRSVIVPTTSIVSRSSLWLPFRSSLLLFSHVHFVFCFICFICLFLSLFQYHHHQPPQPLSEYRTIPPTRPLRHPSPRAYR